MTDRTPLSNRTKIILTALLVTLVTVTILVIITLYTGKPGNAAETSEQSSSSVPIPVYVLGEKDGHLAVYEYGNDNPSEVIEDVYIRSLPKNDQSLLLEGIAVYSDEELYSLLEDLDS